MADLAEFEGLPVVQVGVEMPNAAGGLQEAMKFDPVEWHHGDEGYIVLRYTVNKVRFDPITRGDVEPLRPRARFACRRGRAYRQQAREEAPGRAPRARAQGEGSGRGRAAVADG